MSGKYFKKSLAVFLAIISFMFIFTSCAPKTNPPKESTFSLVMDFAQTTVKVGEKVTYKAILKNSSDKSHNLKYSNELISLNIVEKSDKKSGNSVNASSSDEKESYIAPNGQAEKYIDFIPTEAGEYVLKAYSSFKIYGKDYDREYNCKCEEIEITVVE